MPLNWTKCYEKSNISNFILVALSCQKEDLDNNSSTIDLLQNHEWVGVNTDYNILFKKNRVYVKTYKDGGNKYKNDYELKNNSIVLHNNWLYSNYEYEIEKCTTDSLILYVGRELSLIFSKWFIVTIIIQLINGFDCYTKFDMSDNTACKIY